MDQMILGQFLISAFVALKQPQNEWVAQSVKHLTLVFGSGHGLTVHEITLHTGLHANSTEPAWDSLCLSSTHACALSNMKKKFK